MRPDYHLSSPAFEVLVTLLRRKKTHGWEQDFEVLLVVYRLAHGLSYNVVSRVFDIKSTVCDIVHCMCNTILAQEEVVHLHTVAQCAEVGCGFQQLSRSPAFSHCVGNH